MATHKGSTVIMEISGSKVVSVMNLETGQMQTYVGISSQSAVVAAFQQSKGNNNCFTYDASTAQISKSGLTVSAGDFVALL